MNTTLKRLVSYPHAAVFDKKPGSEPVFRIRHSFGASWVISEGVMTARAGSHESVYVLADYTLSELTEDLRANNFLISDFATDKGSLSSEVLIEGEGDEGQTDGDVVHAYTSLMWVLMGGYAKEVREAKNQVAEALRQMVITQAEGEWLDLWGKLYGQRRYQNQTDADYSPRIPKEAFRLRENPIAIEQAVKDATGKTIRIEEPFNNIFRLDRSTLSGVDKFQDGTRVGFFIIQPMSELPIDWTDVLPVIERNRAAGILVLPPFSRIHSSIDADIDGTAESVITHNLGRFLPYEDRALLDYSTIEEESIPNYPAYFRRTIRHLSLTTVTSGWSDTYWPDEPWSDNDFTAEIYATRSYRVYFIDVVYESTYWTDVPWVNTAWEDYNVLIESRFSRS